MTAIRRDGAESPFGNWIRSHPKLDSIRERLSVTDSDYWIHQYAARRDRVGDRLIDSIMLVELKTNSAGLPFSQRDTLSLISAGLRNAYRDKRGNVRTHRCKSQDGRIRLVRFYGVYLLQLSSDAPDESESIVWHGRQIDESTLVDILRFSIDPDTLRQRSDRRHHTITTKQAALELVQGMS